MVNIGSVIPKISLFLFIEVLVLFIVFVVISIVVVVVIVFVVDQITDIAVVDHRHLPLKFGPNWVINRRDLFALFVVVFVDYVNDVVVMLLLIQKTYL